MLLRILVSVSVVAWQATSVPVRLAPSAFTDLPAAVVRDLERRGCEIPQTFLDTPRQNVVRGRFTSATRTDIAVLCSRHNASTILVFRGGSPSAVAELVERPDEQFMQVVSAGMTGYSRALGVASPSYIREHHRAHGGPKPPPLDHDGINDSFVEKASIVWYWHRGRWLQLQGAD